VINVVVGIAVSSLLSGVGRRTLNTLLRGWAMICLLLFLIPVVALLIWAAKVDRKRRRRENTGYDVNAAARTAKRDAERRSTEWGAGM